MVHGALPGAQVLQGLLPGAAGVLPADVKGLTRQEFEAILADLLGAEGATALPVPPVLVLPPHGPDAAAGTGKALPAAEAGGLVAVLQALAVPAAGPTAGPTGGQAAELVARLREMLARLDQGGAAAAQAVPTPAPVAGAAPAAPVPRSAGGDPAAANETVVRAAVAGGAAPGGVTVAAADGTAPVEAGRTRSESLPVADPTAAPAPSPRGADGAPPGQGGRTPEVQLPTPQHPATIQTPVGRGEWSGELGQRVLWLAGGREGHHAEIKLNPPQLGPLEVKVVVRRDEASIIFNAHHAVTRDAVEQALPRLREMLGESGLRLADAQVSGGDGGRDGAPGQDNGSGRGPAAPDSPRADDVATALDPASRTLRRAIPGLFDAYV